ncbi:MAG: DUF4412 domain-containing protein [Xanthomonadales bacterium]|nr:DUF4412 domain-containing protein [Xanthomonadales bacterium]
MRTCTRAVGHILLLASAMAVAAVASADTTISFTGDDNGNGMMEVSNGKVRMSSPGEQGYMLFEAGANQFIAVNEKDSNYLVFDQAQVEKIARMQEQLQQQMEQQLAGMPPGQREQMRQMMSRMMPKMPGGEAKPRRYQRGGTSKVGRYSCEVLEVYVGDRKASEQCVVGRDDLDIPDDDFETIRAMQSFMVDLANSFAMMSDQIMDYGEPGRDEIPVRYVHYNKILGEVVGELEQISHDAIPPERFEIPAGFEQQQLPEMKF